MKLLWFWLWIITYMIWIILFLVYIRYLLIPIVNRVYGTFINLVTKAHKRKFKDCGYRYSSFDSQVQFIIILFLLYSRRSFENRTTTQLANCVTLYCDLVFYSIVSLFFFLSFYNLKNVRLRHYKLDVTKLLKYSKEDIYSYAL